MKTFKDDLLLKKHLEMLLPAIGKIYKNNIRAFMDEANACLGDTPYFFMLYADGLVVELKDEKKLKAFAEATFNKDTFRQT